MIHDHQNPNDQHDKGGNKKYGNLGNSFAAILALSATSERFNQVHQSLEDVTVISH